MSEQVKKSTRTRPAKPGMVRVVVSLTQEHHDYLEAQAKQESPVFPRAVNEYLSINLAKGFEFMKQQDAKQVGLSASQENTLSFIKQ